MGGVDGAIAVKLVDCECMWLAIPADGVCAMHCGLGELRQGNSAKFYSNRRRDASMAVGVAVPPPLHVVGGWRFSAAAACLRRL
jgi:hypothetical protein